MLSRDHFISLGEQLADSLRMKIVSGEITGNDKLSENVIAGQYGSSRAPVRDALRILESEGLVHLNKQGIEVKGLTERDLHELYDVRFMLESFTFTHLPPAVVPKLADQLEAISDRLELAIVHRDYAEFAEQDLLFHDIVFGHIQHRFVRLFWQNIRDLCRAVLFVGTKRRFEQQEYEQDKRGALNHRNIANALRTGNSEQLQLSLRQHFSYYNGWITKDDFK